MKLWLSRPIESSGLWGPWYDKCFGFVVRAKTEERARKLAEDASGDESAYTYLDGGGTKKIVRAWEESHHSTCVELTTEGDEMVVIRDFAGA